MKKLVNGQLLDMTAEEISAKQAEEEQALIDKQAKIDLDTEKENKKASGKQILIVLGLSDDEIKALMGA